MTHPRLACPYCAAEVSCPEQSTDVCVAFHLLDDGAPCPGAGQQAVVQAGPTNAERGAAAASLLRAQTLGFDIEDPTVVATVVEAHKRSTEQLKLQRAAEIDAAKEAHATGAPAPAESVVYYMRVGNRVKIGYSTNLASRIASVMPEEVLAVEPGGRMLEGVRHRQFADLRVTREWFRHEGALVAHIEKLQANPCVA